MEMPGQSQENPVGAGMTLMRVRITFSRSEATRFTGHLDMQRAWERTLRRSRLPAAYSQGFNPQARIQIACALPLGFTSQCEVLDFWLEQECSLSEIERALKNALIPGIEVIGLNEVDLHQPPLQTQVVSAQYLVTLLDPINPSELETRIRNLNTAKTLIRTRKDKHYDLRPLIEALSCSSTVDDLSQISMCLSARQNATGRPEELLSALGVDPHLARYERTQLIFLKPV